MNTYSVTAPGATLPEQREKRSAAYRSLLSILSLPDALGAAKARRHMVVWGGSYGHGYDWSQWVVDIVRRDGRRREFDGETWFELRLDRLLDAYMREAMPSDAHYGAKQVAFALDDETLGLFLVEPECTCPQ